MPNYPPIKHPLISGSYQNTSCGQGVSCPPAPQKKTSGSPARPPKGLTAATSARPALFAVRLFVWLNSHPPPPFLDSGFFLSQYFSLFQKPCRYSAKKSVAPGRSSGHKWAGRLGRLGPAVLPAKESHWVGVCLELGVGGGVCGARE